MQLPVIVLDVNETLSDLSPLAGVLDELGAPPGTAAVWFASVLRDGFALSVADQRPVFADVARESARALLSTCHLDRPLEEAVTRLMSAMVELPVHPDVPEGVRRLASTGHRLVTLSNGSAAVAEGLLVRAGVRDQFEELFSVEGVAPWKPAASAYGHAAARCQVSPWDMVLVAAHPWDVDGAIRAGLRGVWVNRAGGEYPASFTPPTATVRTIGEVVDVLST
jgi:2-haloacid dehalogenase